MTEKQKQYLLGYLEYYSGVVDGLRGPMTEGAERDFLRDNGLENWDNRAERVLLDHVAGETGWKQPSDWWASIRYWKREEFRCRCGAYHDPYCDGFPAEPQKKLVELAEQVRIHFGRPGHASSGLRCLRHNRDCGGVSNSRHLTGKALDFRIEGNSAEQTLGYVLTLPGVRYAYAIDGSYVHMDVE